MHYCNKSLKILINEILQYFNKNNDIALIMHQHALIQRSGIDRSKTLSWVEFLISAFSLACQYYIVPVIQAAGLFGKTNARHVNEKKGEKL